ncbi:JmjC domain-containing protein [Aphelenchoides besseyi]|nr:JmjC domain-containing protein [Aphelenchoides besseyi]
MDKDVENEFLLLLEHVFDFDLLKLKAETQPQLFKLLSGFWITDALLNAAKSLDYLYNETHILLNTGHYSEIEDHHRVLFALVCLVRSYLLVLGNQLEQALTYCDKGLLLGLDINGDVLAGAAELLCAVLGPESPLAFSKPQLQPEPKSLSTSIQIPVVEMPTLETFYRLYFKPQKPVIIRGLVSQWPCFGKWNFSYLYERCSRRLVPVELGSSYVDADFQQQLLMFGEYLRDFIAPAKPQQSGYLAQHRLLDQIPSLRQEILIPDYCALATTSIEAENMEPELINCFIGPATTVSPLHSDPRHNFFCQVEGKKFVRLIDPRHSDKIYLHDDFLRANSSQVDVEHPDYNEFPLFREVECEDFVMEAGDCLFIPRRYLHYVRALQPSISISIWFG